MMRAFQTRAIIPQLQYVSNKTRSMFLRSLSSSGPCPRPREMTRLPSRDTPWLTLNPEIDYATGDILERFYSPAENMAVKLDRKKCLKMSNSAHCVGSTTDGWLSYVDPNDCSVYLTTPYWKDEVVQLPSLITLPSVLDVKRDQETGAILSLLMSCEYNGGKTEDTQWCEPKAVAKNITSISSMGIYGRRVIAIQGEERRLVYCPKGERSSYLEWLGLQENYHPGESYNQAVYCDTRGLLYTIFGKTGIQAYDLDSDDMDRRSKMVVNFPMSDIDYAIDMAEQKRDGNAKLKGLDKTSHGKHYYLVTLCDGELFLLVKHYRKNRAPYSDAPTNDSGHSSGSALTPSYETLHFDVFRVLMASKELKKVDSFWGRSVFVGLNQSFSVSTDKIRGLRPNCIYFSDDLYDKVHINWGYDHGIFDLRDNCILPLGYEDPLKVPFSENYSQFWVSPYLCY